MRKLSFVATAAVLAFAACRDVVPPTQPVSTDPPALQRAQNQDRPVYIVKFRETVGNAPQLAQQLANAGGSSPIYTYTTAIKGFAAPFSPQAAEALLNNPNVESIELDGVVTASATQNNATWGLDRIDQANLPLSTTYTYNATGAGVRVYIIDTGIRGSHTEFGSRVLAGGYTAISDGNGTGDCNGHGTHVAGTVGGTAYGVAKSASLVAVRVLNCQGSGTTAGVIAGVDWVAANHVKPAVANMSLGGGASSTLDAAVNNAIAAGVVFVVAAGNSNANACNYSPARAASAITVGSTTNTDARSSFSNYGSCVDIFAPGSSITSAWYTSNTAINTISGTSMASPHVAGAAALYLEGSPSASVSTVTNALTSNATPNKVTSPGSGSPNLLLYTGFIGGGGGTTPPPNNPPTASFTYSCSGLTCTFNSTSTDTDGTISSHAWNFGDGTSDSGASVQKTYASAGTRTVALTVTDNGGATASTSQSVTTTAPVTNIVLSASTSRKGVNNFVNLSWTGASSVTVYRNGSAIANVSGTSYSENVGKNSGSANYHVCSGGSCSNTVTVNW